MMIGIRNRSIGIGISRRVITLLTFPIHHNSSSYSKKLINPPCAAASSSFKTTRSNSNSTSNSCCVNVNSCHKGATEEEEDEEEEEEESDNNDWDDDDDLDPQPGDGGAGGGVVLNALPWAERALSIAIDVLTHFGHDIKLYAFKATPCGYIYLRLDKLPNQYGCPSSEELESYNLEYKTRIDQAGAAGEIPDDLGIEVSSPGAGRLLKVPDDLDRFKEFPMSVCYVEDLVDSKAQEKHGVFLLESVETQSGHCIWKLANVKENRDFLGKGRPLNRKQKDWRLNLPYAMFKRVTLYLNY